MSEISQNNLRDFCRTCLKHLSVGVTGSNKILPKLNRIIILFTMDADMDDWDDNENYPDRLCLPCYNKLIDFYEFRSVAVKSAKQLREILSDNTNNGIAVDIQEDGSEHSAEMTTKEMEEDNDDNRLLLPELVYQNTPTKYELTGNSENPIVENPIDFCEVNGSEMSEAASNVKIELDTHHGNLDLLCCDSIGDHADDEEHTLRNGTENPSSILLNESTLPNIVHPQLSVTRKRKRDGRNSKRKRDRRNGKRKLKCPLCDKQVNKQVYLDAHIRVVHEGHEKPFLCVECKKSFTKYHQLRVHTEANHLLHLVCGLEGCSATFQSYKNLDSHRRSAHMVFDIPLEESHTRMLCKNMSMDNFCKLCSKYFSSKTALASHLKRHASIKKFVCKVCGVAKVTPGEVKLHMRRHETNLEKFKCPICPKEFKHKNTVGRHIRFVHEGVRPHACRFCSKRFGTIQTKTCHERLHTGEKPFSCKLCSKTFAQKEGLKAHLNKHDKMLRKYVCSYCSLRFGTKQNHINHENRHRGEKPHICRKCYKGFRTKNDLLEHSEKHKEKEKGNKSAKQDNRNDKDGGDGETSRKHICPQCSEKFTTQKDLNNHVTRYHSRRRHICLVCSKAFCRKNELTKHSKEHEENDNESTD